MASQRITREDLFPNTTSVAAYLESNWGMAQRPPSGAPVGSTSGVAGTMTAGVALITGLADETVYYAYALVGAEHRYVRFRTSAQSPYRVVVERVGPLSAATAALRVISNVAITPAVVGGNTGAGIFYFDPADYVQSGFSLKAMLRFTLVTNAVAPTGDFTVDLRPVSGVSGGGAAVVAATPSTVIAASAVTISAPALSTRFKAESGDFDAPAAGWYCLCVTNTINGVANSAVIVNAALMVRNVR